MVQNPWIFGNEKPIKAVVTQVTKISYVSDDLVFDNGHLSITKKPDPKDYNVMVRKIR